MHCCFEQFLPVLNHCSSSFFFYHAGNEVFVCVIETEIGGSWQVGVVGESAAFPIP
jgi:hypothetical protein